MIPNAKSGKPYPVFLAGIRYRSIFEAAIDTGLNFKGLYKHIEKTGGAPVIVKRQFVVSDFWISARIGEVRA